MAQALRGRMQEMEKAMETDEGPGGAGQFGGKNLDAGGPLAGDRDQAVLLERYYERGYHRNEKYTL